MKLRNFLVLLFLLGGAVFLAACEGDMGPAGPKGETGPAGKDGAKGDKGDKGDSGTQGAAGPQGDQGKSFGDPRCDVSNGINALPGVDNDITGTADDDVICGNQYVNTITGGAGDDTVYGGAGNDTLTGGTGTDTIYGEDGDDNLEAQVSGTDTETTDDILHGGNGEDVLWANNGNNTLHGGDGIDYIRGMGGDDTVNGDAGRDILHGGEGNDTLNGGDGADIFYLVNSKGNDTFNGGPPIGTAVRNGRQTGDAIILESLFTDSSRNGIQAVKDGFIRSAQNNTAGTVDLAAGTFDAGGHGGGSITFTGIENLFGGYGNDTLNGDNLGNYLDGLPGNDTLDGRGGNDLIDGQAGADTLTGGAGADTFQIRYAHKSNKDNIKDFNASQNDILQFKGFPNGSTVTGSGRTITIGSDNLFDVQDDAAGNSIRTSTLYKFVD